MQLTIRSASAPDSRAIQRIYSSEVLYGTSTFEEIPPTVLEIEARVRDTQALQLPFLVAVMDAKLVGYAYAAPYRTRPAYRHTLEISVYVDESARGQGIGGALLSELIDRCASARQLIAVIGDSDNQRSIGLHQSLGFEHGGTLRHVGYKQGRWLDTVLMQKTVNGGASKPPTPPQLPPDLF